MYKRQAVQRDATLVHRRYGHVGISTLAKMLRNNVVSNLPAADLFDAALKQLSVCGACKEGGQKKESFPRKLQKEVKPYAKLHVDIAGPRKKSLGGNQCFTLLIDEVPLFVWG